MSGRTRTDIQSRAMPSAWLVDGGAVEADSFAAGARRRCQVSHSPVPHSKLGSSD
jgi:hypothetical protein